MSVPRDVLVTGCSSGLGRATAVHLRARGWRVHATARTDGDLAELARLGLEPVKLDLCSSASIAEAVGTLLERTGGKLAGLVNNAGYSQSGALEELTPEQVRRQFETNVFGTLRLTQLALPGMRRQRWGRIVNVGSMGGRLTFPGGGIYHATKYALEALSDALRFEVRSFGIDVVLIQPGLVRTSFSDTAVGGMPVSTAIAGRARFSINLRYAADRRSDPQAIRRILVPVQSTAAVSGFDGLDTGAGASPQTAGMVRSTGSTGGGMAEWAEGRPRPERPPSVGACNHRCRWADQRAQPISSSRGVNLVLPFRSASWPTCVS